MWVQQVFSINKNTFNYNRASDTREINEAENELRGVINANEKSDLEMVLTIYDYTNDKEDGFLSKMIIPEKRLKMVQN